MACRKNEDYTFEIVKQVSVLVCGHNNVLASVFAFTTTALVYWQNYPAIVLVMNPLFRSLEY